MGELSEEIYKELRFLGRPLFDEEDKYAKELSGQVALLEAVMEATNPWVPTMAIPNGYDCHYCRAFVRGFPARDWTKIHEEDCVFLKALKTGEE